MPLYDNEGNKYNGKEEIKNYIDLYNFDAAIPDYNDSRKKERNGLFIRKQLLKMFGIVLFKEELKKI